MKRSISSWMLYVRLRREDGARVIAPLFYISLAGAILFVIFWASISMPKSFAKDGLVDGLGSITAVLAGFYVAGLVAIATFFRENSSLDDVIENGPAIINRGTDDEERLTRRQYVCSIFGFLVALSFFLAISAVVLRVSSPSISHIFGISEVIFCSYEILWTTILEFISVFIWIYLFILQITLTLIGLYYLMDRIYDTRPVLGKPSKQNDGDESGKT